MCRACCDRDDVLPALDIALSVTVVANFENPARCGQAHSVVTPGRHRYDLLPLADVARSGGRACGGEDSPVVSQSDRMDVTGSDGDKVPPAFNRALSSSVVAGCHG